MRKTKVGSTAMVLVLALLAASISVWAQGGRGSITGFITDASGAAVPGAAVVATNSATNVTTSTRTNGAGIYELPYLNPGVYTINVAAKGFAGVLRKDVDIQVGVRLSIDFNLQVAANATVVEVTGESTPILESASSVVGTMVDRRRIAELPLMDGNPFMLTNLSAGIAMTAEVNNSQRVFDNAGSSAIRADGAPGGNVFTLDGAPDTGNRTSSGGQVAYMPPADAVEEFKVETASFDAQQGYTAGATVNVGIRSGTNRPHGTLYEAYRPPDLMAQEFFAKRKGSAPSDFQYHRYGGTLGGPVWIPHIYDGRNKTFFFFSYEGMRTATPDTDSYTVPTASERLGDFSALSTTIYDPLTAVSSSSKITRTPFSGNLIPSSRFSTIGSNYANYYPQPNVTGSANGENNYYATTSGQDNYSGQLMRFDQAMGSKHRLSARLYRNMREQKGDGWAGEVNGIKPTSNLLQRGNQGVGLDHVATLSPTSVFTVRAAYTRWFQGNAQVEPGFDLSSLGFPASTLALFTRQSHFPKFKTTGFDAMGAIMGDYTSAGNVYIAPTFSKIKGRHSFRAGYDFRDYLYNGMPKQASSGTFTFGTTYTNGPYSTSSAQFGQGLASLLLGLPTSGYVDRAADYATRTGYHAFFVHDEYKVTANLTINLGLRYELELPTRERYNRNVRGFDYTATSPIDAAVRAAYAASPDASGIAASDLRILGGLTFASADHRYFWHTDYNNVQPRLGVAWKVLPKTVFRAGWGMFMVPFLESGLQQPGFSQSTSSQVTTDSGLTFIGSIANPFPSGVASPAGASGGLSTYIGQDVTFVPLTRVNGMAHRWEIGIQRELPNHWKLEVSYAGTKGYNLPITTTPSALPAKYKSTSAIRDQTSIDYISALITNPFLNIAPTTTSLGSSSTLGRGTLLRPYSQFTSVSAERYDGSTWYQGAEVRLERRFQQGLTLFLGYTRSRLKEKISLLNDTDSLPESRTSSDDRPHRLVVNGIYEMPFGRKRHWGSQWGRLLDSAFGGWQASGIFAAQNGQPISLGNIYYNGDPSKLKLDYDRHNLTTAIFDTTGFYFWDSTVQTSGTVVASKQRSDSRISLSNNIRTFPSYLGNFRGPNMVNLDVSMIKYLTVTDRLKFQLRGDCINTLNYIQFSKPSVTPSSSSFGLLTSSTSNPMRQLQFTFKVVF